MRLSTVASFKHVTSDDVIELDDEKLHSLQTVLTMVLKDINEVCQKENIAYTLGGGTCLGAIRHRGFIPWDDDVDLNMSRNDFEKFAVAFEDNFGDKYWIHQPGQTQDYELAFPRIRLKGTTVRSKEDYNCKECGAYVDIFIVENIPNNPVLRFVQGVGSLALGFAYSCRRFAQHDKEYLALIKRDSADYKIFRMKILIGRILKFMSISGWINAWIRWNTLSRKTDSKFVSIPVGRQHYFKEMQLRSTFFPTKPADFNSLVVPVPADADRYLRSLYGENYMTPPAKEEQEHHVVLEFDLGDFAAR